MQQPLTTAYIDIDGAPAGGHTKATGLAIEWQNGPLGTGDDRKEPNGCFVETLIAAAASRLEHYQTSKFACEANVDALYHLGEALDALGKRTADRLARGVEGSHTP